MKTFISACARFVKDPVTAVTALALLGAGPSWADTAKADVQAGAAKAQVCMACHVADGSRGAPSFPILQGQHAAYLAKQLGDFKSGSRKNSIMTGMAATLSADDVRNVTAFYAGKKAAPGFAKDQALASAGEKIYRGGIVDKQVPACAGCHSPDGAGIPNQYPRIGGQQEDYLTTQLNTFRSGERSNSPQMAAIAARLSDKDIAAVADYTAGLH